MKQDQATRDAMMLVPKFTTRTDAGLEFVWPDGSEPIVADSSVALVLLVAERLRKDRAEG